MKIEIKAGGKTREFTTRRGMAYVSVGSRRDNDIVIDDPGVSPLHLKFEHFMDKWSFSDQMSDNGTKQNGETRYSGDLEKGDRLELGGAVITVLSLTDDQERAPAPVAPASPRREDNIEFSSHQPAGNYDRDVGSEYDTPKKAEEEIKPDPEYETPRRAEEETKPDPQYETAKATNETPTTVTDVSARNVDEIKAPSRKQNRSRVAVLNAVVAILVAGGAAGYFIFARNSSHNGSAKRSSRATASTDPSSADKSSRRMPSIVERQFRSKLNKLRSSADKSPAAAKLLVYRALKEQADAYKSNGLGYAFQDALHAIETQLYREIEERYSDTGHELIELRKAHEYHEALGRVKAFDAFINKDDTYRKVAKRGDMQNWADTRHDSLIAENTNYIGECFTAVDEALQRDDYAAAAPVLNDMSGCEFPDGVQARIDAERRALIEKRKRQEAGDLPAPRKAFDRRKDKLPEAPKSDLLPKGDDSCYSTLSSLRYRMEKVWRAGELDNAACTFYGRKAAVQPYDRHDGHMYLEVTHEFEAGGDFTYSVRYVPGNLPPQTKVSLYEAIKPTRDELLATLMLCFKNGLIDDAQRVACKLWHADESVKADLDQLLATKLGVEVPEGGFIEKDGKLVAPGQ